MTPTRRASEGRKKFPRWRFGFVWNVSLFARRMSIEALLKLIPAQAAYRRVPLDPRLNALGPWQEAVDKFVTPADENGIWTGLVYGSQISAIRLLPAHQKFARDVLFQNAECLDACDRGLERGQLQFAEFQSLEQVPDDTLFAAQLGEVARLYLIRFRLWFSEGDLVSAAEELFRLEKIGRMICNGEGQMLHYLIGLWLRSAAVRGFGHLAASVQTPWAVLQRIKETLDEGLKSSDGLAASLRVDLCSIALAQLDRTIDQADLDRVVESLLDVYYRPRRSAAAKIPGSDYATIADGWLEERRRQMLLLLGGHPKPFDKAATARLMGLIVAETIRDIRQARQPALLGVLGQLHSMRRKMRLYRLAQKTRHWPRELAPGIEIDVTGGMGVKPPAEGEITTVQLPTENLSEARLRLLAEKLRRVENPVGLMLAENLMAFDYSPYLLDHLTKMKTMRRLMKQRLAAEGAIRDEG